MTERKKLWMFFLLIGVLITTIFIALNWNLIQYGLMQAKGQYKIIAESVPMKEFEQRSDVPDSIRQKIKAISRIKDFAENELGLDATGQYNNIYDQNFKEILWVVTAAEPFMLKDYTWSFPFLGELSYKGFFIKNKAIAEADTLRSYGYDVNIRTTAAWSTLGILDDPLLSNVLYERTEAELAELIIHELTHDYLYIKDSVDFNENLASFIGKKGASAYLNHFYGQNSAVELTYQQKLKRSKRYINYMQHEYNKLDSLYDVIKDIGLVKKAQLKLDYFDDLKKRIKDRYPALLARQNAYYELNNAWIMSFSRYSGKAELLEKQLRDQFKGKIDHMLRYYKQKFTSI